MIQRQSSVLDQYDRPVPGAEVYVYNSVNDALAVLTSDGVTPLAQPIETDPFGVYSYWADTGVYLEEVRYGGKLRYREAGIGIGSPSPPTSQAIDRATLAGIAGMGTGDLRQLTEAGREGLFKFDSSNLSAQVTGDPGQGIYVPPTAAPTGASGAWVREYDGSASPKWFGAVGDGATDDTTAAQRAVNLAPWTHFPGNTFIVSALSIPANRTVTFDEAAIIKQKAATGPNTRIITIAGSGVRIGDISVEGQLNQAGDTTGEQNAAIFVYSSAGAIERISIGNVKATNIRGDAVLVGGGANAVRQVSVGHVYANNCYRCGLTVYDNVQGLDVASVYENACGQHVVDIEPDSADPVRGIRIGHIRGRYAQLSGGALTLVQGVEIASMDMDPANGANSTPANAYANNGDAIAIRGALVRLGHLKANGYSGQVSQSVAGVAKAQLHIGLAEVTACPANLFEGGQASYRIERLKATTSTVGQAVFIGCSDSHIGKAEIALAPSTFYMNSCTSCPTEELILTAASGSGGTVWLNCTDCHVYGGTQTGDYFQQNGTRCLAVGVTATMASSYDTGGVNNLFIQSTIGGAFQFINNQNGELVIADGGVAVFAGSVTGSVFKVGANQVVGARGAAVADASVAAAAPTKAEFDALVGKFNTLLARFRTTGGHGLIND